MPDRKMFWRIVRRLFAAQRGRLLVILLALGASAALTAALLNLQVDAASRLTKEFRVFGANVMVAPREIKSSRAGVVTLDESIVEQVRESPAALLRRFLSLFGSQRLRGNSTQPVKAVVAGNRAPSASISRRVESAIVSPARNTNLCLVGVKAAQQLHLQSG